MLPPHGSVSCGASPLDLLRRGLLGVTIWVLAAWLMLFILSGKSGGLWLENRAKPLVTDSGMKNTGLLLKGDSLVSPDELAALNDDMFQRVEAMDQKSSDEGELEARLDRAKELPKQADIFRTKENLIPYVDVLRGTNNKGSTSPSRGNILPLMSRVFGMTHWTVVNTDHPKWPAYSWPFSLGSKSFVGIRCTHQPSPWIGDYAFFNVLPLVGGQARAFSGSLRGRKGEAGFSEFNPEAWIREPAFNKLEITSQCSGSRCTVLQAAASAHGGAFHIAFGKTDQLYGLGLGHLLDIKASLNGNSLILTGVSKESYVFSTSRPKNMRLSVYIKLDLDSSQPGLLGADFFADAVAGDGKVLWTPSARTGQNKRVPAIIARVGTSFIGPGQAKLNQERETSMPFEDLVAQGRQEWQETLTRVSVEEDVNEMAPTEVHELKTELYTCIFRGLLFPRQLGEVDASGNLVHWSPHRGSPRTASGHLSTDSGFWDAYRTVYPMLHLLFPDYAERVSEGWVNAIREDPDGMLPQWSAPNRLSSMVGSMGEVSMAEAIVNGALSEDSAQVAYEYIKRSALGSASLSGGRANLAEYDRLGYIPTGPKREDTVATSQNYYLADHCAANAANFFGEEGVAKTLRRRAKRWASLFDKEAEGGFFRAKDPQGKWQRSFNPYQWRGPYTEGGPWQYRFYVPHDPAGLRAAYDQAGKSRTPSSASHMCDKLLDMMQGPSTTSSRGGKIHEQMEMEQFCFGQYSHNNQPSHHIMYMFAHAGCSLDGQKWIHHSLRKLYTSAGFAGDEDNGEMASWYTLSSLGLYALVPSSGKYQIGAPPLFKKITIHRQGKRGGALIIRREVPLSQKPLENFVPAERATWNGESIDLNGAPSITYAQLLQGGELVFHTK